MTTNTLKITFQQAADHREAARERLLRADAGAEGEEIEQNVRFILNFENFDDIARLMRTTNLELIEAIVSRRPDSIRETANAVERDYRDVHRNLEELETLGVIEFETTGNRKRPVLRAGTDEIDFSIRFPPADDGDASSAPA